MRSVQPAKMLLPVWDEREIWQCTSRKVHVSLGPLKKTHGKVVKLMLGYSNSNVGKGFLK